MSDGVIRRTRHTEGAWQFSAGGAGLRDGPVPCLVPSITQNYAALARGIMRYDVVRGAELPADWLGRLATLFDNPVVPFVSARISK